MAGLRFGTYFAIPFSGNLNENINQYDKFQEFYNQSAGCRRTGGRSGNATQSANNRSGTLVAKRHDDRRNDNTVFISKIGRQSARGYPSG